MCITWVLWEIDSRCGRSDRGMHGPRPREGALHIQTHVADGVESDRAGVLETCTSSTNVACRGSRILWSYGFART